MNEKSSHHPNMIQLVQEASHWIRRKTILRPSLAITLGSGFSSLLDIISPVLRIPYREIPGFCPTGVKGHAGELVLGQYKGMAILFLNGRNHYYEGLDLSQLTHPVRV